MDSKRIKTDDEAGKRFIIELLGMDATHGFDIDSIYFTKENKWLVIELLKCDTVDPYASHPNRYAFNWKKFSSLWEISKKLGGDLWLINYSDKPEWKDHIKLIKVHGINYEVVFESIKNGRPGYLDYLDTTEEKMNLAEFKTLFKELNKSSKGPWEKV